MKRLLLLGLVLCLLAPSPLRAAAKARPKAQPKAPRKAQPKAAAKGRARPTPAAKGGAPGKGAPVEKEPEGGQAFVLEDSDAVVLRDGTRINGTVLCAGAAAVTILVKEDGAPVEKTIPREKIERVIKNTDAGFPRKYSTKALDGHKYLTEVQDEGDPENLLDDGTGLGPAPAPRPRPKAAPKGRTPTAPRTPAKRPATPKLPGGIKLPPGIQLPPGIKLPKDMDPGKLKGILDQLQKRGMLDKMDPKIRRAIQGALKK